MSRENRRGTWSTIRRLEKSVPEIKWYRGELILMSLFVNIFALGLPVFILQVYDRVLPNLGLTTMQFLVVGLIAVLLLDFLLKTIRAAVTTYTGARFEHLARVSAVDHILRTPQDVYENDTPGQYLDKVNAIGVVKDFYSSQLGTLMIDLPFAFFFLGMIWFLGGVIVAVPLTLLMLFGMMAIIVGGKLRRAVDTRSQVDNRRYDFLIEIITGIHTVKAQAFKNLLQRRFEGLQEMSARAVRSVAMQSSIAQGLGSTFGQLNMACVIGTGALLVIDGSLSAGELAACTLLSGRAMQPLQSAMGLWTNFQSIRVACENAADVLELPAEDLRDMPEMPEIGGEVEFRNVSFRYEGMTESFINDLNLRIEAGEMIGIEGDNSSGRSTLLKLMIGLIRPSQGQVLIDGHDLAKHQSESYRKQMAFLSADADVYSGTILDNMTYFRGGKYIRRAINIAKELGLDEEIKRLPEGYGTHVGDGAGGVLPAGFVQRITIVRAMIDQPKIIFFDNANHGLDSTTDRTLLDYINKLRSKATVILVSARPSWLRIADRRYVMSQGDLRPKAPEQETPKLEKPRAALPAPESQPMQPVDTPAVAETPAAEPAAKPAAAPQRLAQPETAPPGPQPSTQPVATPRAKPKPTAKPQQKPSQPTVRPSPAPETKPAQQPAQRPATTQQAKPAQRPTQGPAKAAPAKPTQQPAQRPTAAQTAKPAQQPVQRPAQQATQPAKPAPQQSAQRPVQRPPATQQPAAQPSKPSARPAPQRPQPQARPAAPTTAQQTKPQPKPAATLRAAPTASNAAATSRKPAVLKPQPPRARPLETVNSGAGGAK